MSTATAGAPPRGLVGHPYRWWVLALVLAAEVMDLLDATIVTIAGPAITGDLGGSSTTLHGLDGALLRDELGIEGEVLNLGVQDLRVNQIKFLVDVFLAQYPSVGHVVMVSTLLDYKNCGSVESEFFNPDDVIGYLSGRMPALYYYFRYLDIEGVLKRAGEIGRLRYLGVLSDESGIGSLGFERINDQGNRWTFPIMVGAFVKF